MSGIKISRSATAVVHAEGPGGGDSATLCGKGADYIHGVDEAVTCKGCMKKMPLEELKANTDQILQTVARERQEAREAATVIITGNRIHADGAPCGTVYDDDLISGVDTEDPADCPACLSRPMERIAGDGSMIRVGSRVIVGAEGTSDGSTPTGIVTSLAYYEGGEWVPLVTVEHVEGGLPYGYYAEHLATVPAGAVAHVVTGESGCKAVFPCCGQRSEWYATQRFANGAVKHHECVTACADLISDHEAESHSRRGRECRICGEFVTDHESVKITDGVAVAWWTGTIVDPSAALNPERVATVEARREAARTEMPVKTDAEWAEDLRRAAIRDGVYRHIMGQPPVNPAIYGSDQVAALAHVHAWLTGHWGCECTGYGPNGGKLVYLLTGVSVAGDTAPLTTHRCGRGTCTNEGVTPGTLAGMDVFWCVDHAVLFAPSEVYRAMEITGDDLSMIDDADDLDRFIAAGRQSLTGTAWRVRPGASKRKIHKGR